RVRDVEIPVLVEDDVGRRLERGRRGGAAVALVAADAVPRERLEEARLPDDAPDPADAALGEDEGVVLVEDDVHDVVDRERDRGRRGRRAVRRVVVLPGAGDRRDRLRAERGGEEEEGEGGKRGPGAERHAAMIRAARERPLQRTGESIRASPS